MTMVAVPASSSFARQTVIACEYANIRQFIYLFIQPHSWLVTRHVSSHSNNNCSSSTAPIPLKS